MSWISENHKKIYSQAFSMLCEDVKTTSSNLVNGGQKLITTGYNKIKKYYNDDSEDNELDNDNSTDDALLEMGDFYPDILVSVNKGKYISKICVIDDTGHKRPVKGKILSYKYIDDIIHKWFNYKEEESGYRWVPSEELGIAYQNNGYRESHENDNLSSKTPKLLDTILFRYGRNGYEPQKYHPLA